MTSCEVYNGGTSIIDLSEELVEEILRQVTNTASRQQFWNCSKTCKQRYLIGLPLFGYIDVSIPPMIESTSQRENVKVEMSHSLLRTKIDFSYGPSSRTYIHYTRSLTLHLSHVHTEGPQTPL